jgi:6-phosphogluconolactonase (cycloisomerase 2 family)
MTYLTSKSNTGDQRLKIFVRILSSAILIVTFSALSSQAQTRQRNELTLVANQSSNNLSVYQIRSNGALRPVPGSPFAAGGAPNSIAVVASGRFAYVADTVPGSISGYNIDQSGVLTPVPGSPFAAADGTAFVIIDPSGRFLYALNCGGVCSGSGSGNIEAYTIDQQTGVLTPMAGSPFAAGQSPFAIAVDPTGHFAYVANFESGDVFAYSIDSQTGALTQIGSPIAAGTLPLSIVVDPWGQFVYTANTASGDISAFAINFDGSLGTVVGSPFAAGNATAGVAPSSNGKFLIAAAGDGAFVYSIDNTGALHLQAGSPVAAGVGPNGISIDPSDNFVYIVNAGSGNVSAYRFNDQNGNVAPLTKSPFPAGSFSAGITTAPAPTHR